MLDDLSLTIAPGERVLLVGPSGSGKSTLLRAIAGLLLTADAGDLTGTVRIDGVEPATALGSVGLVLQDPGAGVVAASVWRDVAFGLENLGMPREDMAAPIARALAEVGLTHAADADPTTLSGGESQRLALAGALAMSPRVLLLDEPTAMLDPDNAESVRSVVRRVARERGLTTVIVEHRLGPWLGMFERPGALARQERSGTDNNHRSFVERLVVIGADGSIVADGRPADVLEERGDALADAGIWVPGRADPEPLALHGIFTPEGGRSSAAPAVSARNVTIRRVSRPLNGAERVTTTVADVDLEVAGGHTLALVGPSGSGKSSLLAALGGLVEPTTGTVRLGAAPETPPRSLASPDLARAVAWVPQRASSTILRRTVRDEVTATSLAVGVDAEVARVRADILLDRLGLAHLAGADPRQLSGGEQRRLAVASAVVHEPSLVLADEPTVGQDRLTWAAVVGVLEAVRSTGSAVVVATHDDALRVRSDEVRLMRAPDTGPEPPAYRTSLAARCGPLSLLLACLLVLPLPALVDSWRQALAVLGVEVVLGLVALSAPGRRSSRPALAAPVGRLRRTAVRLLPVLVGVLGVGWSTWLLGGHNLEVAIGAMLRVLALVLPSVFLLPFVDTDTLGDQLTQRVRLPERPVVAATAALHRFQTFGALWSELVLARRVRGVGAGRSVLARVREAGATTVALLVGALGEAGVLALAMDARGFAAAHRRTRAAGAPWLLADTLAVCGGLLVVGAAVVARILLPA